MSEETYAHAYKRTDKRDFENTQVLFLFLFRLIGTNKIFDDKTLSIDRWDSRGSCADETAAAVLYFDYHRVIAKAIELKSIEFILQNRNTHSQRDKLACVLHIYDYETLVADC